MEEEVVVRASYDGGWWASSDAGEHFAPSNMVDNKEYEDVKKIVLECIEMLEADFYALQWEDHGWYTKYQHCW